MVKRAEKDWRDRVKGLVEKDIIPDKWMNEGHLAEWVQAIDPYLLLHTPAKLHQLLGKRKNGRWILPLSTAQRLMLNQLWENEKAQRLKECFGNNIERIGMKSLMQLERGIDEMVQACIDKGLEIAGLWQKGFKITHVDSDKKAKELGNLIKKYVKFKGNDVKSLKGDN